MSDNNLSAVSGEQQPEKKKKRRGGLWITLLCAVLILGGGGLAVYSFIPHPPKAGALTDMDGNLVVPDDPSATSSAFLEAAAMVVDDGGEGLVIPSVNLKVPLGSVNEVNGVMNPANFTSAFWIRNRGVSLSNAADGTVYIVAHATRFGMAPGNIVQSGEKSLVQAGDFITANGVTYEVTGWQTIPQSQINTLDELWLNTPGMLVFVTCVLRNDHEAPTDNLIITGQLVP